MSSVLSQNSIAGPRVAYCGFTDTANIGDYALLQAAAKLVPRLQLVPGRTKNVSVSLFGGGTSYPYCLRYGTFPRRRLNVAIGLGVVDPTFSGRYGPLTLLAMHWSRFKVFGVRGYRSREILAHHGISSVVTGDTALALERPSVPLSEGAVGVCLVGEAMDRLGDPVRTRNVVMDYCRRLLAEGCQVTLVPFCRTDFVQALEMHRELGERVTLLDFWAPPIAEDLDVFLSELARLQFMVGERLHSAVLAAAMAVPFVAIPYKPKCLDFVGSIDPEFGLSLDYDQLTADNLWRRTRDALVQGRQIGGRFADRIATLRRALRETAEEIEGLVLSSNKATEAAAWVG